MLSEAKNRCIRIADKVPWCFALLRIAKISDVSETDVENRAGR